MTAVTTMLLVSSAAILAPRMYCWHCTPRGLGAVRETSDAAKASLVLSLNTEAAAAQPLVTRVYLVRVQACADGLPDVGNFEALGARHKGVS